MLNHMQLFLSALNKNGEDKVNKFKKFEMVSKLNLFKDKIKLIYKKLSGR